MGLCGAKAKSTGKPCRREAGWGTDHFGEGRCRFHGGATPIKSGRYSTVQREGLRQLIDKHQDDEAPLDVLPELALAKAILEDYVARYDEMAEALLAWNAEQVAEQKRPVQIPDIADVILQVERITKIAQREKKLHLAGAISRSHLERIFHEQRRIIEHEADPDTAERIIDGFYDIRV